MPETSRVDLETALAEAVHRARNDLQAVTAMLQLQAAASTDPAVRQALLEAEGRVHALSSLNARLDVRAKGVKTTIDSTAFLDGLMTDLRSMHFGQRPVAFDIRADSHRIAVASARPLGLILNELVVNALKYAFPEGRAGTVSVDFRCQAGECVLTVRDDGIGIDPAAPPRGTGLGRRVIRALTTQIGGAFTIGPGKDGIGTECTARWPAASVVQAANRGHGRSRPVLRLIAR
ncbi:MAG TPA: sensor histidine kinase [Acetobacteraceae bacterium]|nr:sensor histidine kinase [Acetobacteraceae bacterium]